MSIIKLSNVSKFYSNNGVISSGFSKVNLSLDMGEFVVITGESGSGKSTLLNVISGLDSYQEGEMYINGEETSHYSEEDLEVYRRRYIGNIFQTFNLINSYTVYQNIELVLLLDGANKFEIKDRILDVIDKVGLTKFKNTKTSKLSGGQKQRVAIARSLVKDTPIIVADEPTGNLDRANAKSIMKLLYELSRDKLVVIVTHNYEDVEAFCTRKITMSDGNIISDKVIKKTDKISASPREYKNIKLINKIILSFRNTFNIPIKFFLLMLVYLFLTLIVFSSYGSLRRNDDSNKDNNISNIFPDGIDKKRLIITKKDRSEIFDSDIDEIRKINNVKNVVKDDFLLDKAFALDNKDSYVYGKIKNISEIKKVHFGRMPTAFNEIVVRISKGSTEIKLDAFYNLEIDGNLIGQYKIVGYLLDEEKRDSVVQFTYGDNSAIYCSDAIINKVREIYNRTLFKLKFTINDNIYDVNRLFINLEISDKLVGDQAITSDAMDIYCKKNDCINSYININAKSLYVEDNLLVKVVNKFNRENINKILGLSKEQYEDKINTIFVSRETYSKMFNRGSYQTSVIVNNVAKIDDVVKELSNKYTVYPVKDYGINPMEEANAIVRVVRVIMFAISLVTLFLLSYFIITLILKSRNVYYSTVRILGGTKKICRDLLIMELFTDINISYIIFIFISSLANKGFIKLKFIADVVKYFRFSDYIYVYIILALMSIFITLRYSRKVFKYSALEAYREEI